MTDNEIIKALEWCSKGNDCQRCEYQPTKHRKGTIGCSMQFKEDALDLINRQKAEIERLTEDSGRKKKVQMQLDDAMKMYHVIKAEAVKEFAERLKSEMIKSKYTLTVSPYSRACNAVISFWTDEIDNIAKEMVGDA